MKLLLLNFTIVILISGCNIHTSNDSNSTNNFSLEKIWSTDTLLTTCESTLYDKKNDVIYVSNINRELNNSKKDGFISKINTEGKILDLKWIDGLTFPKGMGLYNDTLYVTEINTFVIIDIQKGEIINRIPVVGSEFLNDISVDENGVIYISDSKTNKVFAYSNGKVEIWLENGLDQLNGIFCEKNRLLAGGSDLYSVDYKTKEVTVLNDSINGADGVVHAGNNYYFVSNWPGEIYLVAPDSSIYFLIDTKPQEINTADIDYIENKNLLLVPTFFKNRVDAYRLIK